MVVGSNAKDKRGYGIKRGGAIATPSKFIKKSWDTDIVLDDNKHSKTMSVSRNFYWKPIRHTKHKD